MPGFLFHAELDSPVYCPSSICAVPLCRGYDDAVLPEYPRWYRHSVSELPSDNPVFGQFAAPDPGSAHAVTIISYVTVSVSPGSVNAVHSVPSVYRPSLVTPNPLGPSNAVVSATPSLQSLPTPSTTVCTR